MNVLIKKFLIYLKKVKQFSSLTIKTYESDLLLFFNFLKEYLELKIDIKDINIFILKSVEQDTIYSFLVYLANYRDNVASSRQRKLYALKSFYRYLYNYYPQFRDTENVLDKIEKIEPIFRLPKYFTFEQAKKIQNIFNSKNCKNPERNNAIMTCFLHTGLRISELIGLNISDVDFDKGLCKVMGKGRRETTIYFNNYTLEKIKLYLSLRNDNINALFISNKKKRIGATTVEDICKDAFKLAGINNYNIYAAHTLRHTAATIVYKNTKDILVTQKFLRHEQLSSTLIYTHVENEKIKKAVDSNPLSNFY